jgi:two-component system sensor histidine kinase PilS (NtrC family)
MSDTIRPCPLSNYRLQADSAWRLLCVFTAYQVVLGVVLLSLQQGSWLSQFGQLSPKLFLAGIGAYLLAVFASLPLLWLRRPDFGWQASLHVLLDLTLLPLIVYASGGLESGFAILLAVSVTASGLLIGGRCALGFAALASLDVLALESLGNSPGTSHFPYAAMLGIAYFTIAWLAMVLAQRAEQSQLLAEKQQVDLANLEQLNEFIVQHLQSGILVLDSEQRIRLCNDSALRLLDLKQKPKSLAELPQPLTNRLQEWQAHPNLSPLSAQLGPIQMRFSQLPVQGQTLTVILVEDMTLHHLRVQESKLASLGRLTASIAHEIRNPLSAIHHAAQLLAESQTLAPQDLRLLDILQKHCRRVDEIINNVLELSRRQAACRKRLVLNSWLEQFCLEFQEAKLRQNLFDLKLEAKPLSALVDASQLKQILSNLCENALKHGMPKGGKITLKLFLHPLMQKPCIEVIDRGSGIPQELRPNIFEPFFTTSPTGTGLGLYIARELAQLNQASLEYVPLAQGSCFRLLLANADQLMVEL